MKEFEIGPRFPRASLVAQTIKNLTAMQQTRVQSLGQEDLLKKEREASLRNIL